MIPDKTILAKFYSVSRMMIVRSIGALLVLVAVVSLFACSKESITSLQISTLKQARISYLSSYPDLEVLDLRNVDATEQLVNDLSAHLEECIILWLVPIGSSRYDNSLSEITLPDDTNADDIRKLSYFSNLERVNATKCVISEALLKECLKFSDIAFTWSIAGVPVSADTSRLDLSGTILESAEPLQILLKSYPNIIEVDLTNANMSRESLLSLKDRHGNANLIRNIEIAGKSISCWEESIDLTGIEPDEIEGLIGSLSFFPTLETVDLSGQPFPVESIEMLKQTYPDVYFNFTLNAFSKLLTTNSERVDLSEITIKTHEEVASVLRYFPNIKEVNLCDTGINNSQMEQLIDAFPGVKFIWYIRIGGWKIRTDITAFSKGQRQKFLNGMGEFLDDGKTNFYSEDLEPLKYCKDLIFLDLGHGNRITDLSILYNFPKLRGLILSMNKISDITPISSLKKLESLEIYQNYIVDLSPLSTLSELKYLNLSINSFTDITPLLELKQLQKLWLVRNDLSEDSKAALVQALPECEICFWSWGSGSGGWRDNPLYFEYQKAFDLPTIP